MPSIRRRYAAAAALALAPVFAGAVSGPVTVRSVSPQGEVAQVRQITVKFSADVVPFGDLRQSDPMRLQCTGGAPGGAGHWVDPRVWVWDFAAPLPAGVRCTLRVRTEPTAPAAGVIGPREFSFRTGAPAVLGVRPAPGQTIAEDQYFVLRLSGAVAPASAAEHSWCEVDGVGERIGVRVVDGAARAELLQAQHIEPALASRTLVLSCQRPLPNGAAVRVVWGPGIASATDPKLVTHLEQPYAYTVRAAFTAQFSCERERANAGCWPVRPVTVQFSAPVARAAAAGVRLRGPGGLVLAPLWDKDDTAPQVESVRFATPLPEQASLTIELPAGLVDDAARPLANAASFPLTFATSLAPPIAKFAAAPFGVVERADPVLPVTLRHVQDDLRSGAPGGQVRIKTLHSDAEILAWYRKVQRYDETQLSAQELGWPESQWVASEVQTDAHGKRTTRRHTRMVATREVSLLARDAAARRLDLPQLAGPDPRPFEVVGIPLPGVGLHVVEIESARLGQSLLDRRAPMYVRTSVLVTNLGVHLKQGRERSVVWVTSLDLGQPVAHASVSVYDCEGRPLWHGTTDAQGLAQPGALGSAAAKTCASGSDLYVSARHTDADGTEDTAFVLSGWQKGIEDWRFNLPTDSDPEPDVRAVSVLDRSLLRAGQTVSMKHFVRLQTSAGLAALAAQDLPTRVKLVHQGSGQEVVQPLRWSGTRDAVSSWTIPANARLGVYDVVLEREARRGAAPAPPARQWRSGEFRVEEFRLPLVDARIRGPGAALVAPKDLALAVQLNYFSGGAMAQARAQGSALVQPRALNFAGYEDYAFEPPQEAAADAAPVGGAEPDAEDDTAAAPGAARLIADKVALATDRQGAATWVLKDVPALTRASELTAQVSFNDPNGEVQTASATLPLWPSAVVLGLRTAGWVSSRGKAAFTAVALDTEGHPLAGQRVDVRARLNQVVSTRKRMVGGFYAYDNRTEHKDLGALCAGTTDARGLLHCEAVLDAAGQVEIIASARDAHDHPAQAAASVWVTGQGELWFAQDNDDRIDVLAEKPHYEPGETARLQVRMPFREATALVAVEREGVLATHVVTLRGADPTVELKIEPEWGPNVYVSVLALRGRLREVPWYSFFSWGWSQPLRWARSFWYASGEVQAPTATVDLSRPAFKLGVAQLKVGTRAHQLQVHVSTDRSVYAVRQTVQAHVQVLFEGRPMAGAQVAFAAVDEGLLALQANPSWDLLDAMVQARAWGVQTSTAQSEIIGRRHYGRKAVAAGGGGGHAGTRELFDTLLLWQPEVTLDAQGRATVQVPLNDSLTSFRLVAVADAGVQQFGTGSASVRVTQDLQVLPGLPLLVRDGDRYRAMLTLRNTTARSLSVRATLRGTATAPAAAPGTVDAPGGAGGAVPPLELPAQDVALAPGAAAEIGWTVQAAQGTRGMTWEAAAEEQGSAAPSGRARDRVQVSQRVIPAVPVQVLQATLMPLEGTVTLPIAAPADALSDAGVARGGVLIAVQPQLTGALPGLRRYFENYPYACLEQKVSKSVGLHDALMWAQVAAALPGYLDADGLAGYFPARTEDGAHGSDRLSAYVLAASHEAGFELPAAPREALLGALVQFVQGRIERRDGAPAAARGMDLDVRKLAAVEALARYGRATPRMLGSIRVTPNLWPTAAVIDWLRILHAVDGIDRRAERLQEANQILRSRLSYSGTTLKFNNEDEDFWWWLMDSADANAARLILAVLDDPGWRDELPRLVAGTVARQRAGAWGTTTANLWGSLALDKFAQHFESVPITGRTAATMGEQGGAVDWRTSAQGGAITLAWPRAATPLNVAQDGSGRPWLSVQSVAAVPLRAALRAGYTLSRSVRAVQQQTPNRWSRGDVLRVHIELDAQTDMTWVVLSDPVPAGATILGSGLGRDDAIATRTESRSGTAPAAFEERALDAFRSYYEDLPHGKHVIEYTLRLNNPGTFSLPPTRVEAMYAPQVFGALPNAAIEVAP